MFLYSMRRIISVAHLGEGESEKMEREKRRTNLGAEKNFQVEENKKK